MSTHTDVDTEYMTGQRFHRTVESILRRPWKSKTLFVSRPIKTIIDLVAPSSGCRLLAWIGAEIGTYMIGEGRSALQTAARTIMGGGGVDLHRSASFRPPNLNGQIGRSFGNLLVWLAPGSLMLYFLGSFPALAYQPGLLC